METYNGWKNRSTWLVALHIENTQGVIEKVESWINSHSDYPNTDGIRPILEQNTDIRKEQSFDWNDVDWLEIAERFGTL